MKKVHQEIFGLFNEILMLMSRNLHKDLMQFWPGFDGREGNSDNDCSERHLSYHFCRAAQSIPQKDLHCYFEVTGTRAKGTRSLVDAVVIDSKRHTALLIESKKLYDASKVAGMMADIEKMLEFELNEKYYKTNYTQKEKHIPFSGVYGILLGTLWDKTPQSARADLWTSGTGETTKAFLSLAKKLKSLGSYNVAFPVINGRKHGYTEENGSENYMKIIGAIFPIKRA